MFNKTYYIVYVFSKNNGDKGVGTMQCQGRKIKYQKDINEIVKLIKKENPEYLEVTIINWKRIKGEDDD